MSALRASVVFVGDSDPDLTVGAVKSRPFGPGCFVIRVELIPQVFLVVFEFVLNQKIDKLFLEASPGMMLTLIANISGNLLLFRLANAECTITFLPPEAFARGKRFMYPSSRIRFHCVYKFGDRNCRRQRGV